MAGRSTLAMKAAELGLELDGEVIGRVLDELKRLEHEGYHFEVADGSLELLLRRATGWSAGYFTVESFRVITDHGDRAEPGTSASTEAKVLLSVMTEATVKVHVGSERIVATAEGNGPVNALDGALRGAIGSRFPALSYIHLTDYRVRVLDTGRGTGAVTRVLVDTTDGQRTWTTIGVSENIIEASWQALYDSIVFGLLHADEGASSRNLTTRGIAHDRGEPAGREVGPTSARPRRQQSPSNATSPQKCPTVSYSWPTAGTRPALRPTCRRCSMRTPYGRRVMGPLGRLYAERGYQVVIQSCRGTFGSEGDFEPMRNERVDGGATLEWVAAQPWFDGRLVTWGGSYLGLTQWAVVEDVPDFVKAMCLQITAADFRTGRRVPGRVFRARDRPGLDAPGQASGARLSPHRARADAFGAGDQSGGRGPSARQVRHRDHRRGRALLPAVAGAQHARGHVVGRHRLRPSYGAGAAGQLDRRLVRHLPAVAGGRLRGAAGRRAATPA